MGTLGYMSPEQVKARPADARSDIFALGRDPLRDALGQRAFRGDSAGETMAAILKEEPPELSLTNQKVPPGLERIVRHCLEKNPERRFQSASDIAFDLEALSSPSGSAVAGTSPRRVRQLLWPSLAILAALVGLGAGVLWMFTRSSAPPSYRQLTFRRGQITGARFAPDGQTVVFSGSFDGGPVRLYSLRPGSPQSSPLDLSPAELLSVARSGELAVLVYDASDLRERRRTSLARVPMSGGSPRILLEDADDADWAPDGNTLAVTHTVDGRSRLEHPIGTVLYQSSHQVGSIRVSPSGDQVAFVDYPIAEQTGGGVMVVDRSGQARTLSGGWFDLGSVAWPHGRKEVWFAASRTGSRRSLWAVSFSGRLRPLAETPGSGDILDVSTDGRVLFKHAFWRAYISGVPPGETTPRDFSWLDFSSPRDLSDDGKLLLFQEWGEGGGRRAPSTCAERTARLPCTWARVLACLSPRTASGSWPCSIAGLPASFCSPPAPVSPSPSTRRGSSCSGGPRFRTASACCSSPTRDAKSSITRFRSKEARRDALRPRAWRRQRGRSRADRSLPTVVCSHGTGRTAARRCCRSKTAKSARPPESPRAKASCAGAATGGRSSSWRGRDPATSSRAWTRSRGAASPGRRFSSPKIPSACAAARDRFGYPPTEIRSSGATSGTPTSSISSTV